MVWFPLNDAKGDPMKAITDLFSTDYGLMSIGGIAFMIGMGVFFLRYFKKHIDADAAAAARRGE
jgi:hypothetical protein